LSDVAAAGATRSSAVGDAVDSTRVLLADAAIAALSLGGCMGSLANSAPFNGLPDTQINTASAIETR
jgi:hypothetical protein